MHVKCEMIMNRQSIKLLFQQSLQYLSALRVEIVYLLSSAEENP